MAFNLSGLNDIQLQAVVKTDGPVLILAGAGSGKTRVLTYRIAYLIHEKHVHPGSILAVTFTNKAAKEMKERVEKLLHSSHSPSWMGTFHSIGARILRMESRYIGYQDNFSVYDVDDQIRALKKVISGLGVPQQLYTPKMIQNRLSRIKNQMLSLDQIKAMETEDGLTEFMPAIYTEYHRFLTSNNAMDFDDLLIKPLELFEKHPDIREKYALKFKFVLVDEYQDTNRAQYLMVKYLVQENRNICVVGDEDQSIYGWRGADIQNILNFNRDFPEVCTFKLEQNYRSKRNILKAANALVSNNKQRIGKNLWSDQEDGEKIRLFTAANEEEEAKRLIEWIHEEMYTCKRSFKEIAILYRTNSQSRAIEDALRRNAINYTVVGGVKFYERKENKDILAYLRVIDNPNDSVSLKRIINFPLRGIGETTTTRIEKFSELEGCSLFEAMGHVSEISSISPTMGSRVLEFYAMMKKFIGFKDDLSAAELASTLASEAGIQHHYSSEYDSYESESRLANIKELFNTIEQFSHQKSSDENKNTLSAFLEEVSLLTDVDTWNSSSNCVSLMTLHAAKGLEFPVVIITGVEMGVLPLQRYNSTNLNDLEEERRLFYVGMTRAEERLYLTYARQRRKYNNIVTNVASMFLDELPEVLIQLEHENGAENLHRKSTVSARRKKIQSYFDTVVNHEHNEHNYIVGQPVYHAIFGQGEVVKTEGAGDKMKITVFFKKESVTKKLIAQYANLSQIES
jgi:DNA helicase-2/ATP-dependent DNA helicase PcrA